MSHAKIGVLIPTYNRRSYLETALTSVRGQSWENLEIIVIDNGSTDGTAEFMAGVSDPRIRYVVNQRDLGLIGSINKGVRLFSGEVEWCTILCDDDLLDADCIETLFNAVGSRSAKTIVHAHKVLMDAEGNRIRDALPSPPEEPALDYLINRSRYRRETFLSGIFFTRTAFDGIGGYPQFTTGLASDDAFIFALSLKDRLVFERYATVFIRMHADAESHQHSNMAQNLQSMSEFGAYCDNAAKSGHLTDDQMKELSVAINKYVKLKNSSLIVKRVLYLTSVPIEVFRQNLLEVRRISKENKFPLVRSAKLIVLFAYLCGLVPAAMQVRKLLQTALKTIFFFRRIVLRR